MVIQQPDSCASCAQNLPEKTCAWWDSTDRTVTCTACRPVGMSTLRAARATLPPPAPIDHGTAGASAERFREHRAAKLRQQPGVIFGETVIGDIGVQLAEEPPSRTRRAKGADGKHSLADFLDREVGHAATILTDRRVPTRRGNIDHLVVASTGVWVIDVKNYFGRVESRNAGGRQTPEPVLFVAHRNQTNLIVGMTERAEAVEWALERIGLAGVPVRRCLCFTRADWGFRAKPFTVDGVWIGWPEALAKALRASPVLERSAVATLAHHLSVQFPASG